MKFAPHIIAEVWLLPTEAGGRKGPTPPDIFVCQIGNGGEYREKRMDLSGMGSLSPGSTVRVPIRFSCPEYVLPWIGVGTEFSFSEAGESGKIGGGEVLEVCDANFAV
jgi:hypothetical protein